MKCGFCGADVPEGSSSCPRCGYPLNGENSFASDKAVMPPPLPEDQVRCTACGATLPAGTRFCPQCGASLCGPSDEEKGQMQQQKAAFWDDVETKAKAERKSRRRSSLIGWVLRLIGIAVILYLIYSGTG